MIRRSLALMATALALSSHVPGAASGAAERHSTQPPPDVWAGGVRMIPIHTSHGDFKVWTKQVGRDPKLAVLLLHGGPGETHDYMEAFDSYLPRQGIEYIYYDQLGAGRSDHPKDDRLWTVDRFVDEVEQVRSALGLDRRNFCLFGHSWGGILAIEYALRHQRDLKCLVVSNMMASIPAYNAYARNHLEPAMDQKKLAEVKAMEAHGDTGNPRYMQLLLPMHYEQHVLRRPAADWPEPVNYSHEHTNKRIYELMQGPSELGASGRLEHWDRFADLAHIETPTLVIGARYDTMDPRYLQSMARQLPRGRFAFMPEGSHLSMYDDQVRYFSALTSFLTSQR